jgi:hypothetical protein
VRVQISGGTALRNENCDQEKIIRAEYIRTMLTPSGLESLVFPCINVNIKMHPLQFYLPYCIDAKSALSHSRMILSVSLRTG